MHECDEADIDYDPMPSCRRWTWLGFSVEMFKPLVGLFNAFYDIAQACQSAVAGIYGDLTAHYNFRLQQRVFEEDVLLDLETIKEA